MIKSDLYIACHNHCGNTMADHVVIRHLQQSDLNPIYNMLREEGWDISIIDVKLYLYLFKEECWVAEVDGKCVGEYEI